MGSIDLVVWLDLSIMLSKLTITYVCLYCIYGLGIVPWVCINSEITYSPLEDDIKR
jgi:hypothetical protein